MHISVNQIGFCIAAGAEQLRNCRRSRPGVEGVCVTTGISESLAVRLGDDCCNTGRAIGRGSLGLGMQLAWGEGACVSRSTIVEEVSTETWPRHIESVSAVAAGTLQLRACRPFCLGGRDTGGTTIAAGSLPTLWGAICCRSSDFGRSSRRLGLTPVSTFFRRFL